MAGWLNTKTFLAIVLAIVLAVPSLWVPGARADELASIGFGFPHGDVAQVETDLGRGLSYCSIWVVSGFTSGAVDGFKDDLDDCTESGTIPVVHWYYWADRISDECVDHQTAAESPWDPCRDKNQDDWFAGANLLADTISGYLPGKEVWVTVELEWNKGGMSSDTSFPYELRDQARIFNAAGLKTVAPFGSWSFTTNHWQPFLDEVTALGSQILYSCYRDTHAKILETNEHLYHHLSSIKNASNKPLMVFDWGISSYSEEEADQCRDEADYEAVQASVLDNFFDHWVHAYRDLGVFSFMFRLRDDPGGSSGWHGDAEKYFGFVRSSTHGGGEKPAYARVLEGIAAEDDPTGNPPPPDPSGATEIWESEVESFSSHSTGQQITSSGASGNAYWALWTNGNATQDVSFPSTATYEIHVVARGDYGSGWPTMRVLVDYQEIASVSVDSTTWKTFVFQAAVDQGTRAITLEFTNDNNGGTGNDRNLKLDVASVWSLASEWIGQAEDFTPTAGTDFTDAGASGGRYWNLWSNGSISATMRAMSGGENLLRISARGDVASNVWPTMKVYVDETLVATHTVNTADWSTYATTVNVASGDRALRIEFDNDVCCTGGDRNLKVDYALLSPAASERWRQEAEDFDNHGVGQKITSSGASGGEYWALWSNGDISTSFTTDYSGTHEVRVQARGDLGDLAWPIMKVYVDNVVVLQTSVETTLWQTYAVEVDMDAGAHTLKVEFTNDNGGGSGNDRNLKMDWAAVWL